MHWIYVDVEHLVPGTTAVSIPHHLQHISYVPTILDDWYGEQLRRLGAGTNATAAATSSYDACTESIALLQRQSILEAVSKYVMTALQNELIKDCTATIEEDFAEAAAAIDVDNKPAPRGSVDSSKSPALHNLSLMGLHHQVLSTAARLYVHQLISHEKSVVLPWRNHLERLREHHVTEMDTLLVSTTTHMNSSSGGNNMISQDGSSGRDRKDGERMVVNSNHLQSLVDRHSAELQGAEDDLAVKVLQSAAKARADFCSLLSIAAEDVRKTLLSASTSHASPPQPAIGGSALGSVNKVEDPNSIDSFFAVRGGDDSSLESLGALPYSSGSGICAVEYRKVPNPYSSIQQGGQLKSKDPVISAILLGFSRFSDFLPCASLYTKTDDDRGLAKAEAHFERTASGRNGGVLFIGDRHSYVNLLQYHERQSLELVLQPDGATTFDENTNNRSADFFLVRDRCVERRNSTNMWCGTKQWFVDPSTSVFKGATSRSTTGASGGKRRATAGRDEGENEMNEDERGEPMKSDHQQVIVGGSITESLLYAQNLPDDEAQVFYAELFSSVLNDAVSQNVDHLTIVLLPTGHQQQQHPTTGQGGRAYLFTPLLHGLVDAVAQAQLAMGGGRQAVTRALNPGILPTVAASTDKNNISALSSSQLWWSCAPVLHNLQEEGVVDESPGKLNLNGSFAGSSAGGSFAGGSHQTPKFYTKQVRHNFNTSMRLRVFVPDQAYHLVGSSVFASSERLSL